MKGERVAPGPGPADPQQEDRPLALASAALPGPAPIVPAAEPPRKRFMPAKLLRARVVQPSAEELARRAAMHLEVFGKKTTE